MQTFKNGHAYVAVLLILSIFACNTIPDGASAVKPFDKNKYLGKWYEVARLDFKQERNLIMTSATYSLNEDGSIKVDNRGYDTTKNKWTQATGKAKFVDDEKTGMLKVSFFGPFYSGYNVIAIDPDYRYALVAGEDLKYLWILSRDKTIPPDVKDRYLKQAEQIGYRTADLIWVKHSAKE